MNLVLVVASGLFQFFNRTIITGLLGKAIFFAVTTWVVSQMFSAMVASVLSAQNGFGLTGPIAALGSVGQYLLWFLSWTVIPGVPPILAALALRFAIRRMPIVG